MWFQGGIGHLKFSYFIATIIKKVSFTLINKVDMWSTGVIMAELLNKKPFYQGSSTSD